MWRNLEFGPRPVVNSGGCNIQLNFEFCNHLDGVLISTELSSLAREGRALNGRVVADITHAELLGRRNAEIVMTFLKNEIPGFQNAFLADTATQVGIRETRRIVGRYILTEDDVLAGKRFDDGICLCSWPLEICEEGKAPRMVFLEEGRYYGIPYRSLLPREVDNLLVTGRAISMDH
jgi:hypothetical protein